MAFAIVTGDRDLAALWTTVSYEADDNPVTEMTVSDARDYFAELIERAGRQPVYLARHGRGAAVTISTEHYDALVEAAEDVEGAAAADAAMGALEAGADPWEQVKEDLGHR
jgi:prevent-host-death family protein